MTINMFPSQARMVLTFVEREDLCGTNTCPAIITNVNGSESVDLFVMDFSTGPEFRCGVPLFDTEEEARSSNGCYWPSGD